jgi:hypothetical protein
VRAALHMAADGAGLAIPFGLAHALAAAVRLRVLLRGDEGLRRPTAALDGPVAGLRATLDLGALDQEEPPSAGA